MVRVVHDSRRHCQTGCRLHQRGRFYKSRLYGRLDGNRCLFPFLVCGRGLSGNAGLSVTGSKFRRPYGLMMSSKGNAVILGPLSVATGSRVGNGSVCNEMHGLVCFSNASFIRTPSGSNYVAFPTSGLFFLGVNSKVKRVLRKDIYLQVRYSINAGRVPRSATVFAVVV